MSNLTSAGEQGEDGASPENSMEEFIEDDVHGDFTSGPAGSKPLAASASQLRGCLPRLQIPIQPGSTPAGRHS